MSVFKNIQVEILGASHSEFISVQISNLPNGEDIDITKLQEFINRRKSANSPFSTKRVEEDKVEIISGLFNGKTDGSVLLAKVHNRDIKAQDYNIDIPRPSHADLTSFYKYGRIESGGGKFSGRMTLGIVIAGGIVIQMLRRRGIEVAAYISEIGNIKAVSYKEHISNIKQIRASQETGFAVLDERVKANMFEVLKAVAQNGDSLGGIIECIVFCMPNGIGGPLFDGIEGRIASSLFAIPAVKGIEFGLGFDISGLKGSESNDQLHIKDGRIVPLTNNGGGIDGGISNGMPITLRVAVKPTPSISKEQKSVSLSEMKNTTLVINGRHDVTIVPRAVVCVEAAVALSILDCLEDKND